MSLARQPGAKTAAMQYLMSMPQGAEPEQAGHSTHQSSPPIAPAVGAAVAASTGAGAGGLPGDARREVRPQQAVVNAAQTARPQMRLNLQSAGQAGGQPKISSARQGTSAAARGLVQQPDAPDAGHAPGVQLLVKRTANTSSAGSVRQVVPGAALQRPSTAGARQVAAGLSQPQRQRSTGSGIHPAMR